MDSSNPAPTQPDSHSASHDKRATPIRSRRGIPTPLGIIKIEHSTQIAAAIFALLYAAGFMIVNSHLQNYEVLKFELVRTRYIAAALLLLVTCAPPLGFFLFMLDSFGVPLKKGFLFNTGKVTIAFVIALVISFITWLLTTNVVVYEGYAITTNGLQIWVALSMVGGILWGVLRTGPRFGGPAYKPLFIVIAISLTLMIAKGFGVKTYPEIEPGFGGGKAWLVDMIPASDSAPLPIRSLLRTQVAIVDRNDQSFLLMKCNVPSPHEAVPRVMFAEIASSRVSMITVRGTISANKFIADCKRRQDGR
jgi:hypothetical protein